MLAASAAQTSATWHRAVKRWRARRSWLGRSLPGCTSPQHVCYKSTGLTQVHIKVGSLLAHALAALATLSQMAQAGTCCALVHGEAAEPEIAASLQVLHRLAQASCYPPGHCSRAHGHAAGCVRGMQ